MTAGLTKWVRFDWPLKGRDFEISVADEYRLRAARPDDLEAMQRVVATSYASDAVWAGKTDAIEQGIGARIRERISDPAAHFVLAECGGQVIGLNGVAISSPTKMNFLTGICVDPEHQGRGLGTALLGQALAWLRDQGLASATVTTDADAVAARVYDRFGGERTGNVEYPGAL
ncbi:MAG: GNAT family N-acetyltransferase [Alphaproteobacteria bacterium]|nr:GNAT family N-acetyltransferase [Alphaproteobacteria bacterium]